MFQIQLSTTARPLLFLMVLASDSKTPATGLSPTVTLSKNGAAFGAPAGAVSEVGNGWYAVAGHATDRNTLGHLLLHATAATADPTDMMFQIVAYNPEDAVRLGVTSLPNAAAGANGGLPVLSSSGTALAYTVTLPATAPNNWLAAASIAAGALNGKGDWSLVGSAMTLTSGERTTLANVIEAEIIDETDSEKVLTAITNKIASVNPDLGGLTVSAIASAAAAAVWAAGARTLTAGTNIVLPANALGSITAWTVNLTGTLSGSVGSVTSPVTITGDAATAGTRFLTLTTPTQFTETALALAPTGGGSAPTADENAAALLDLANSIETGVTVRKLFRLMAAVLGGKSSAGGTKYRNLGDTADVVEFTVDSEDNRTAVVRNI